MLKLRTITIATGMLIMVMASLLLTRHCYSATYYKYTDKNGTTSFTDNRQSIPEEYKKKAIKIADEKENADKKSGDNKINVDNGGDSLIDKKQRLSSREKIKNALTAITNSNLFRPVAAITIFLTLFIVIGKIGSFLGRKQISSVLRIALTAGILLYLFHTQAEQIVNIFGMLKKDVTDTTKKAEERNREVEDAAKDRTGPARAP